MGESIAAGFTVLRLDPDPLQGFQQELDTSRNCQTNGWDEKHLQNDTVLIFPQFSHTNQKPQIEARKGSLPN